MLVPCYKRCCFWKGGGRQVGEIVECVLEFFFFFFVGWSEGGIERERDTHTQRLTRFPAARLGLSHFYPPTQRSERETG